MVTQHLIFGKEKLFFKKKKLDDEYKIYYSEQIKYFPYSLNVLFFTLFIFLCIDMICIVYFIQKYNIKKGKFYYLGIYRFYQFYIHNTCVFYNA